MENNYNNTKLLEMIKKFMYDSKFKDLGIYSKQYLCSVLYNMYKENSGSLFSLAFGDFDGLRKVNDTYSIAEGDKAMYTSLNIIKNILPSNTIIARAAGDEFLFLSNSLNKKDWDIQIDKIRNELNNNKNKIYGLNITMDALDSTLFNNFDDLYKWTEANVGTKKHTVIEDTSLSTKQVLNNKILNGFRKFFNYYRLNEGTPTSITLPSYFYDSMDNNLTTIIANKYKSKNLYMQYLENSIQQDDILLQYANISKDTAYKIHNILTNSLPIETINGVNEINNKELNDVFHFHITEPLTKEFSKGYYRNYLCDSIINKPDHQIAVQVFDLVHLKLSNDTVTHLKTDQKISELFKNITTSLHSKINYSDFKHDYGNYLISYGGKLISIENNNFNMSNKEISDILTKARSKQPILDVVTARKTGNNKDLQQIIKDLSNDCVEQKQDLKIGKITSEAAIVPLNIALKDALLYFEATTPDPYDLKSRGELIQSFWDGMCAIIKERYTNKYISNNKTNTNIEKEH